MTSPAIQAADKAQKAPRAVSEVSFFSSFFLSNNNIIRTRVMRCEQNKNWENRTKGVACYKRIKRILNRTAQPWQTRKEKRKNVDFSGDSGALRSIKWAKDMHPDKNLLYAPKTEMFLFLIFFSQTHSPGPPTPRLKHNVQIDVRHQVRLAFSPGLEYFDLLIHWCVQDVKWPLRIQMLCFDALFRLLERTLSTIQPTKRQAKQKQKQ